MMHTLIKTNTLDVRLGICAPAPPPQTDTHTHTHTHSLVEAYAKQNTHQMVGAGMPSLARWLVGWLLCWLVGCWLVGGWVQFVG